MTRPLLRLAAGHGLRQTHDVAPRLEAEDVDDLLRQAQTENLLGLLDQAVADGTIDAEPDVAKAVGERNAQRQVWALRVERHHLEVHRLLRQAGIDCRFLKGPTFAHRVYEHPDLRLFVDVDVLVPGADIERAATLLAGEGHQRVDPELLPGFAARWGKSVTLRSTAGVEVDLHRTLAAGAYGLVASPEALWARPSQPVQIGTTSLPAFDLTAALVHACVHAVTGRRTRLGSLRDVANLAVAVSAHDTGLRDARDLADALSVTACIARAAQLTITELELDLPPLQEMAGWPVGRRDERWLQNYRTRTSYTSQALVAITAPPRRRDQARYAIDLARAWRSHCRDAVRTRPRG